MAPRLTADDRLQRLITKCRERVDEAQPPPQALSHTPDSKLGSLAREAGYERLSALFSEKLGEALREAGVGTHPDLTDPMNTRDTRIHFYDLEHPLPGTQQTRLLLQIELEMSGFLERNFAARVCRMDRRHTQMGSRRMVSGPAG
ncbi:hypothetical protein [Mycolicibacterium confluentis]|uniref:Uncharacterized protein n=1 Tax=Mycolicibacterium confluentis TaxID=28047 RepID=A0A7I7XV84_9MYCO|nr:hypothetical protein [Mycolicibacterium confluentis]MCV7322141.1 hypothetical protein [Mycolicibacterium confluentis]BBZ32963.1 hypothetical protein MCNF_15680 [Mycolicibacterium confluentis]